MKGSNVYFLNGLFYAFLAIYLFAAALMFHPLVKPRGIVTCGPWLYVTFGAAVTGTGLSFRYFRRYIRERRAG